MHFETSPSSSASSTPAQPITIGSPTSQFGCLRRESSPSLWGPTCSFPSWPSGDSLSSIARNSAPSSFISDEDLFPEGFDGVDSGVPVLLEAPAPPKEVPMVAMPLPPLYASEKPKKRRRSSRKQTSVAKPMTPIVESAEAPE